MAEEFKIGAGLALDGEAEFKRAISGINKDLTVLGSEMKKVTAQFDENAGSMDALSAKQDVYNRRADEQRKKVELMTAALESAKKEYGENSDKVKEWQIKLNNAEADLSKTESAIKQTANQIENFGRDVDTAGNETKQLGNELDGAGGHALSFGDVLKANVIGVAIVEGVRALGNAIKGLASDALEAADSIQQMADATGMSAEQVQEWTYVGDTLGTSIDTITGAQAKLTKSMAAAAGGTGAQAKAFAELGVSATDGSGNLRDAKTVMLEAFDALGKVGNETERDALAMSIFGKSAQDLNPLIKAGSDELSALAQQAIDTGAVMSGDTVAALDDFGDMLGQLKQSATAMAGALLEKLLPSLQPIIENMKNIDITPVANFLAFILNNSGTIAAGLASIGAGFAAFKVISTITGLVEVMKGLKTATEANAVAQKLLNLAQAASPIGIVIALTAALVAGIVVLWNTNEGFRTKVIEIWTELKTFFQTTITAIAGFFTQTIPTALNQVIAWFNELPGRITATIQAKIADITAIGTAIVQGVWQGISSMATWFYSQLTGFFSSMVDGVKKTLKINSPSKVFAGIGSSMAEGIGVGFEAEMNGVAKRINASVPKDVQMSGSYSMSQTEGLVNGLAAVMGSAPASSGGPYTINLVLDGKTAASVLFDPLKGVAKQRGVAFG